MHPLVEFYHGNVTTRVHAAPEILAWFQQLLTIPNTEGWPPTFSFWNSAENSFLTGHLHYLERMLRGGNIPYVIHGCPQVETWNAPDADILATPGHPFRLKSYQQVTSRKMIGGMRGGNQLATGGGKTSITIASIKYLEQLRGGVATSLTVVMVGNLADQWVTRMRNAGLNVAKYGADTDWRTARHVVAVVNGVYKKLQAGDPDVLRMLQTRDILVLDEGHHTQADMCYLVGVSCTAQYRWSLSATLYACRANPYLHPGDMKIMGVTGPTLSILPAKFLWENGFVPEPEITFVPIHHPDSHRRWGFRVEGMWRDTAQWRGRGKHASTTGVEWDLIVNNDYRNEMVRRLTYWPLVEDPTAQVVILVQRKDHGEIIQRALATAGIYSFCSYGASRVITIDQHGRQRQWTDRDDKMLAAFEDGTQRVMIGTQKFDEGQSFPLFTDLILAQAGRGGEANRRVYQRVGRGMHSGRKVRVRDFYDRTHQMVERQAEERIIALRREEYPVQITFPPAVYWDVPRAVC